MPQRFLRPGIRNSKRWNSVSIYAQSFYIRIITLVDDYGRYDGRTSVLHGECWSVWNEQNRTNEVSLLKAQELLDDLCSKELVEIYESEGKKVLQITQWQERIREGTVPKWPEKQQLQQLAATRGENPPSSTTTTTTTTPSPSSLSNRGQIALTRNGERTVELLERCKILLGADEMKRCHRRWHDRAVVHPDKLDRVLNDMDFHRKNGGKYTKSAGARAEELWKEFK